jgi:hypothetical protein
MEIEVVRADLARVRIHDRPPVTLAGGEARLRVDAFALTSNNISYAAFGDALRYWEFFPPAAPDPGDEGTLWGRIPVWGFAEVIESRATDAAVGERVYGYLPMGSELVVTPGRADGEGFSDTAPHRAPMAGASNRYVRTVTDPVHRADREDHQMVLYPLYVTSFLVEDFIADHEHFGADRVVLSSASAKTAVGIAFDLHRHGVPVVGLTSPGNVGFVEGLGVYDEVHTYDAAGRLEQVPSVYVDIAGNADVRYRVHERLGSALAYSMTVGGTHWDHRPEPHPDLPGPPPQFFFAPAQIAKRNTDWGREVVTARMGEAWGRYAEWAGGWIDFRRAVGPDAVIAAYRELLEGRTDPRVGHVCSLPAR